MNHDLDARAARAMGWNKSDSGVYWVDPEVGPIKCVGWSPTTDANHFEEMLREIERRGEQEQYAERIFLHSCPKNLLGTGVKFGERAFFASLETRTLAACETLEAK